jgi:hypothetical protein
MTRKNLPQIPLPDEQPITVNALRNMRARLTGEIQMHNREIGRLRAELIHLDATLRLFDPATDPEIIPALRLLPRRADYFGRGELTQRVYDAFRENGTVSAKELAEQAMAEKNVPDDDRALRKEFRDRFQGILHNLRRKRTVEKIGHGPGVRWKLAPEEPGLI